MRLLVLAATIAHTTRAARYALRVAYDGTHFNGWQVQPNARTVEGELRRAFTQRFDGANVPLLGASRTDSGVHARGQAAHVDLPEVVADVDLLKHQLNRMLPDDVRINCVREAPPGGEKPWHAIACSTGKRYSYRMTARYGSQDPLERLYRAHVCYEDLDFALLSNALQRCRGRFDFKAFANNAPTQNPLEMDTIREIRSIEAEDEGFGDYTVQIELDGALYRMVRNVVGACVACGTGKLKIDELDELLSGRKTRRDNPTKSAPARGLCLEEVFYDDF